MVINYFSQWTSFKVIQSDEMVGNKCNRVKGHRKIYVNDITKK